MIPAWLGIIGLGVIFLIIGLFAIIITCGIIDGIEDKGFKSYLKGILKEWRWILFVIIIFILVIIGIQYLDQLLSL